MNITQKCRQVMICSIFGFLTCQAWSEPQHHLGQKEFFAPFCHKTDPKSCGSVNVFEQTIRDGCLNSRAYRGPCIYEFCNRQCARSPCPSGHVGQLCKIYCRHVRLSHLNANRLLNACLMKKDRTHPESAFHKQHIQRAHTELSALEKVLRERDILFHVDGLHLGSHNIVRPKDFRPNVDMAIKLTKKALNILHNLESRLTVQDLKKTAKYKIAASDEHAQYFAIVTSDLKREVNKIREAIIGRHTSPSSGARHLKQKIHPKPVFADLITLLEERASLLSIDAVKEQNGGIVRLHEFIPHTKQILSLTYLINHIYQHLKDHYRLTESHHNHVKKADHYVLDFVDQVYALNQDCHQMIRTIAGGATYLNRTYYVS